MILKFDTAVCLLQFSLNLQARFHWLWVIYTMEELTEFARSILGKSHALEQEGEKLFQVDKSLKNAKFEIVVKNKMFAGFLQRLERQLLEYRLYS